MGAEPYTCVVSPDGKTVFVSVWGGAKVLVFDAATLEKRGEVVVGEHPNAMAWSKDGQRLFVACANTNAVWVVDVGRDGGEGADLDGALPELASRIDAQRARAVARRRAPAGGERRQQHRGGGRRPRTRGAA